MHRIVGILGLLALLAIAWALSYHRRDVRLRVVIWGLALQLLFAVIILREGRPSFAGMVLLGLLLLGFIFRRGLGSEDSPWPEVVVRAACYLAAGWLVCWLIPAAIPWAMVLCVVLLAVNGRWRLVEGGQRYGAAAFIVLGIAFLVSRGIDGQAVFQVASDRVAEFLSLSDYGAEFLFGNLTKREFFFTGEGAAWPGFGFQFAFKVLPTIVFFGAFMAVLYHLGIMHRIIDAIARFMRWTIGTSGAETFSCSANIFVGQTEGPLLIKPYLGDMTRSELLTVMVGGFATIAGGVLAGYIAIGIPAGHLIAASVMSAPAALVVAKIIFPEKERSKTAGDAQLEPVSADGNVIEAAANGITDGLKLAVNVGAMLLGFIALIAVLDVTLNWIDRLIDGGLLVWLDARLGGALSSRIADLGKEVPYNAVGMSPVVGEHVGLFPGSLQTLFGTVLRPLAWLMGVPWADADEVGNLLGIKLSLNEFVAYGTLSSYMKAGVISEKSMIIATYALCGFANFSSIGIQIGGISAVAPSRKADLAKLGLKAMFGGALASWLTATIAGILL